MSKLKLPPFKSSAKTTVSVVGGAAAAYAYQTMIGEALVRKFGADQRYTIPEIMLSMFVGWAPVFAPAIASNYWDKQACAAFAGATFYKRTENLMLALQNQLRSPTAIFENAP